MPTIETNIKFGELIKKYRKQNQLTQLQLAEKLNMTEQNIYKYEHGLVKEIPFDKLMEIIGILKIPYHELPKEHNDNLYLRFLYFFSKSFNCECLVSTDFTPHGWQLIKAYAKGIQEMQDFTPDEPASIFTRIDKESTIVLEKMKNTEDVNKKR